MKKISELIITTTCMILTVSTQAQELRDGKYVFECPALFNAGSGKSNDLLCELVAKQDHYALLFMSNEINYNAYIGFTMNKGIIKFDAKKSDISMSEIWREVSGSGTVHSPINATGKLKVSMGSVGFLLMKNKSSEWSLRPAKRIEVLESYTKGLQRVQSSLAWSPRQKDSDEDAALLSALRSNEGCGYLKKDVPLIMEMIRNGDIVRDGYRLFFKEEFLEAAHNEALPVEPTVIPTNVVTELIDVRDVMGVEKTYGTAYVQKVKAEMEMPPPTPANNLIVESIDIGASDVKKPIKISKPRVLTGVLMLGVALAAIVVAIRKGIK